MKVSGHSFISISKLLASIAMITGCSAQAVRPTTESIHSGIAHALVESSLSSYTKSGCLDSLNLWKDRAADAIRLTKLSGGVFFLGDSYLVYDFAYLNGNGAEATLTLQTPESILQLNVGVAELTDLAASLAAARQDTPPLQPPHASHTTCVVFLDKKGNYFVVQPDESTDSIRQTDRVLAILDRAAGGAP